MDSRTRAPRGQIKNLSRTVRAGECSSNARRTGLSCYTGPVCGAAQPAADVYPPGQGILSVGEARKEGMTPRCPACGALNLEDAATCAQCGKPLPDGNLRDPAMGADLDFCPACLKSIPAGSKFCAYCGATIAPRSESVDALIADQVTVRVAVPPVSSGGKPGIPAALLDAPTADHALPGQSGAGAGYVALPKIEAWLLELKTDGSRGEQRKVEGQTSIGRQG